MGITGEKRERQVKGRHDKVKVVSKIKHVNSNGVLHGPHRIWRHMLAAIRFFRRRNSRTGRLMAKPFVGPTALIVNRRQGAEGAYGGLPLDLSPPFVDRGLPGDLSGMTVGRVFKVKSVCVFRSRRG